MLTPENGWNLTTRAALFALVVIWAVKLVSTWTAWGNLTVDSGHEMYVPSVLAEGKALYKDVWFMYFPAAPYFNSYLFRLFGVHLNVLYLAGSFSALGSAIFLFLTGMRLGSWLAGWMAGAVLLLEVFQPSLFCFPLPYSFSAVYGCLTATCFLWMIVRLCGSNEKVWMFGAGIAAAAAMLLKLEFGAACYAALGVLIVVRGLRQQSWKIVLKDFVAILPGLLLCTAVIGWMVSLRGAEFITQENFMSWPTSYFIKTYGKFWLESTGFSLNAAAFAASARRTVMLLGIWQGIVLAIRGKPELNYRTVLRIALFVLAAAQLFSSLAWREALLFLASGDGPEPCGCDITELLESSGLSDSSKYGSFRLLDLLQRSGDSFSFLDRSPVSTFAGNVTACPDACRRSGLRLVSGSGGLLRTTRGESFGGLRSMGYRARDDSNVAGYGRSLSGSN
ncbi:MAG: hypothetical protein DMG46_16545 [Acidobacteria bacterium]|nr:MAG: hypothetical protein DMG46_16545 [Acidobacteriota bacterium]